MTTKVLPAPADSSHTANLLQQYGRGPVLLQEASPATTNLQVVYRHLLWPPRQRVLVQQK
jgi:hypothetical protein